MARRVIRDIEIDHDIREPMTGDAAAAPTLVWGHGLTSSRGHEDNGVILDWSRLATSARVLRYDARGHGLSTATDDATMSSWRSMAVDQLALADASGIGNYTAGGASMGCGTALHAAVLAPERIDALVLVIPPTAWETRQERVAIWAQMASLVETAGIEMLIGASADIALPDPLLGHDEVTTANQANLRSIAPERLAAVFRGAGHADLPSRADVASLSMPAIILAWAGDTGHPVSTAQQLHELMPQSELSIAATWDEFSTWTDRVNSFLAG